jgi:hypothetical protein
MSGVDIIQAVDDTLKRISSDAVAALTPPRPGIAVGPLDVDREDYRLNWFLYRIGPNLAYRNMEPPRTGLRAVRGHPPLALELRYLLTAFPAAPAGGDEEQFAHVGLAAVMRALHSKAIVGEGDPVLAAHPATKLVEPLRITMDTLDLESLSKIWTAAAKPIRLSVGYLISLVVVDATSRFFAGPPVRDPVVDVVASIGPRFSWTSPERISFGIDLHVGTTGLTTNALFVLKRTPDDPAGPSDWPMTVVSSTKDETVLRLPRGDLAPGGRRLDVVDPRGPVVVGRDATGIAIAPMITGPAGPIPAGGPVDLVTVHAASDVEAFVAGVRVAQAQTTYLSPTSVRIVVPAATPVGPTLVSLRANHIAGPDFTLQVGP